MLVVTGGLIFLALLTLEGAAIHAQRLRQACLELVLLALTLCGAAMALLCPIYLAVEPTDVSCASRPLLLHASVHLLYVSLFARLFLVYVDDATTPWLTVLLQRGIR